jgi:hypothetical protein
MLSSETTSSSDAELEAMRPPPEFFKRRAPPHPWSDRQLEQLLNMGDKGIPFNEIAYMLGLDRHRGPRQAREKYRVLRSKPDQRWSKEEDRLIRAGILKYEGKKRKWDLIVKTLPTKRTNIQVKRRWMGVVSKKPIKPKDLKFRAVPELPDAPVFQLELLGEEDAPALRGIDEEIEMQEPKKDLFDTLNDQFQAMMAEADKIFGLGGAKATTE